MLYNSLLLLLVQKAKVVFKDIIMQFAVMPSFTRVYDIDYV